MAHDTLDTSANDRELLRFITCGSVDDGKSTLLGRLLYETKLIFEDQLAAVARDSRKYGTQGEDTDLALLLDGLEAEREQGITIDVAYRFFSTAKRAFIAADTPGHEQFTRNMTTAASTANAAVILVDARKGVLTQTRRHAYICSLLGVRTIMLAVNKMDLVDFDASAFFHIVADFAKFASQLGFATTLPIPVCARDGDNVTQKSNRMGWYAGPTLLEALETAQGEEIALDKPFRFPVQWVNRPSHEFRGFAGTIASGSVRIGDPLVSPASGQSSRVSRIVTFDGDLVEAHAGQAVTLTLEDEIDLARGDVLCPPDQRPDYVDQVAAWLVWMSPEAMLPGRSYLMRTGTATIPARVSALKYKVDVNTRERLAARTLELNEIGYCNIAMSRPAAIDPYTENRRTGAFILIDRATNETAGAGMIRFGLRRATNIHRQTHAIGKSAHARALNQKPMILWFTGLSGSGKSTIADLVERELHERGFHTMLLDGDNVRHGLNNDLGFTDADRVENIRRIGEVSKLFVEAGLIVLCCFISPFAQEREMVRALVGEDEFIEIFVDTPLDECERRDPKGLYAKARAGQIANFTGVSSPYEAPQAPSLRIDGASESAQTACARVTEHFLQMQASTAKAE
jgi:bifunctional enzyme CysN/CysC